MSESVARPVPASPHSPQQPKREFISSAGTADLHKSFEGRHKLTPFQLQISAVNRVTGAVEHFGHAGVN